MIPAIVGPMINHLWQSTIFALAVWTITLTLKRNRAETRYGLWIAASLKFLVPFSLLVSLGNYLGAVAAVTVTTPTVLSIAGKVVAPFSDATLVGTLELPKSMRSGLITGHDPVRLSVVTWVWFLGFASVLVIWFRRWRRIKATVRHAQRTLETPGLRKQIPIAVTETTTEPGLFGIVRPVILLPAGIHNRLTSAQLEAIVAHELSHARRRDNLIAFIHMMVEAIFWFFPLVWWIGARMVSERELACDEDVVRLGNDPFIYAEAILTVCEFYAASSLACVSGITGEDLKKRIDSIVNGDTARKLNFGYKVLLAVAGFTALGAPVLFGFVTLPSVPKLSPTISRAQSLIAPTPTESLPSEVFHISKGEQAQQEATSESFSQTGFWRNITGRYGTPDWETASVKPCEEFSPGSKPGHAPGKLDLHCQTVRDLIQLAYVEYANAKHASGQPDFSSPMHLTTIEGGPAWINLNKFDINAKAAGEASKAMMLGPMMQRLLEDRFKLKIRREVRQASLYALTIAKSGPQIHRDEDGIWAPTVAITRNPLIGEPNVLFDVNRSSLAEFSTELAKILNRPVIDKTGITGAFDFHLEFGADDATPGFPHLLHVSRRTIFTALPEQLGLQLELATGPVEFLAIDQVERPGQH